MAIKSNEILVPDDDHIKENKKNCGDSALIVLGFDFQHFSRPFQFFIGTAGIFVFFITYGYIQELMFQFNGFKPHGFYMTFIQFIWYTIFSYIECSALGKSVRNITVPIKSYLLLAFLSMATMGLSNSSVGYLNYPTQVIFKCCKLIPTMIGSVLILGKKYSCMDVTAMLLMVVGLAGFVLADSKVYPNVNTYGIFLICLALCVDGVIGNVQEQTMKNYSCSSAEIVFYSYGFGIFYLLIFLIISGQFLPAFHFFAAHPKETYGYTVIFSITGYVGVQFILLLVKSYGALPAVTVSTCRKAVSIILSFMWFSKPFTMQYLISGIIVVLGIYLNVCNKDTFVTWWASFTSVLRSKFRRSVYSSTVDGARIV